MPALRRSRTKVALTGMPDSAIVSPRTGPLPVGLDETRPGARRTVACRPERRQRKGRKDEGLAC